MTARERALVAAAAVEAACGLVAAAWVNALGGGHQPVAVFVACTVAVP